MLETELSTPVGTPDTSRAVSDIKEPVIAEPQSYSKDFVDKMKKEKDNWRTRATELEADNKKKQEEQLLTQEKYKELSELKVSEANEWKEKYETSQKAIAQGTKVSKLKEELIKIGAKPDRLNKMLKLIDLNSISFDSENNVVTGHDSAANALLQDVPEFFGIGGPKVGHNAPASEPIKEISLEEWKKLSPEEKLKTKDALYGNLGIRTKVGY